MEQVLSLYNPEALGSKSVSRQASPVKVLLELMESPLMQPGLKGTAMGIISPSNYAAMSLDDQIAVLVVSPHFRRSYVYSFYISRQAR